MSAWVDGDGSILLRHQTETENYLIDTAPGLVTEGVAARIVYTVIF